MLVITRYRLPEDEADEFRALAMPAVRAFAERPGCEQVRFGRSIDEPDLWVLTSSWANVGAYRRALSHPEVKVRAVPLMYRCLDEPTAFEDLIGWDPDAGLAVRPSDRA